MAKTICDNCIHDEVCGLEGHLDEAMTFCANKSTGVPVKHGKFIAFTDKEKYETFKDGGIPFDGRCSMCNSCLFNTDKYCPECGADMRNDSNLMKTEGKVLAVGLGGSFKDSLIKTEVEGLFLNFEQGENNE